MNQLRCPDHPRANRPGDDLTDRQSLLFEYLLAYTIEHCYQPSMAEMAVHFGISLTAVQNHLVAMAHKGWIGLPNRRARAIEILVRKPTLAMLPEAPGT